MAEKLEIYAKENVGAVITRYAWGWKARRDTCGFLCWNRNDEWNEMTDSEAGLVMEATVRA